MKGTEATPPLLVLTGTEATPPLLGLTGTEVTPLLRELMGTEATPLLLGLTENSGRASFRTKNAKPFQLKLTDEV